MHAAARQQGDDKQCLANTARHAQHGKHSMTSTARQAQHGKHSVSKQAEPITAHDAMHNS